ncbi:WYL domain-containing protein [Caproiciproducens galactitolivorans]|uniref:WYL domain-containing protein n=1 Tax=Caproiciproducens galactitolivorans TaxID=642589 RepID=A0ABT4BWF9_9FIRM|nr:WYL domain-containing protein [Caproiciproducens galactitolivorans]MCY1714281.1 WYL domain-containing protein [Caproiciproducens galactitolivorans]
MPFPNLKKIAFCYHHSVIVDQKAQFDEGRKILISPYALLWHDDQYYLAGNNEKYDSVSNYRIDRMKHVELTDLNARPFSEVSSYRECFDTLDYSRKSFHMFHGRQERIVLRCSNDLLEAIVDKFGSNIELSCHDKNAFTVRASVFVSDGLVEWLMQYGDRIVVLSPKSLKDKMITQVNAMRSAYQIT